MTSGIRWFAKPISISITIRCIYGAGRQIVTWGRSDGVTVLDVVTPRNFRNPLTFEQERFMIPQDMLNVRYDLSRVDWLPGGITKELQVIWNWDYTPSRFPGFRA